MCAVLHCLALFPGSFTFLDMHVFETLPWWGYAWLAVVMVASGFFHGLIGFGFPIIATPLLTLMFDFKTALLLSVLPGFTTTILNTFRGGNLGASLGRFWFMPAFHLSGAFLGTLILIRAPSEPFILLLAGLLVIYLYRERLGKLDVPLVKTHWILFGAAAGLAGGIFEATANVALAPLIIYFMIIGVAPAALVQVLNLCFMFGKATQIVTWTAAGNVPPGFWLLCLPWAVLSLMLLLAGERIRRRVSVETYMGWLRKFLWAMVALLIVGFVRAVLEKS